MSHSVPFFDHIFQLYEMNTIVAMEILRLFVTVITGSFAIHALSNVKVELCEDLLFVNHKMAFYFLEHNSGTSKNQ